MRLSCAQVYTDEPFLPHPLSSPLPSPTLLFYPRFLGPLLPYISLIQSYWEWLPTMASESGKLNSDFGWKSKHYIHPQIFFFIFFLGIDNGHCLCRAGFFFFLFPEEPVFGRTDVVSILVRYICSLWEALQRVLGILSLDLKCLFLGTHTIPFVPWWVCVRSWSHIGPGLTTLT